MESITTFKFIIEENGAQTGDIRRVTLKAPVSFDSLRSAALDILKWKAVTFRFKDDDGDMVTVGSQYELDTAIALAKNGAVRFLVSNVESAPKEEVPKEAPAAPKAEAPKAEAAAVATPDGSDPLPPPKAEAAAEAAAVPAGSLLDAAPNATIPENVMVQFSAIAEFFQKMAQQMAEFAPRIPVIVNEGIAKMSANMQNNFAPLDVSVKAARDDVPAQVPLESYGLVIHRLPETVVHPGVECAHCHKKPITGMRYKCVQCDCDLCQDCIVLPNVHTEGHRFLPVCAPAVGSHLINSASEACTELKNRAAPVVESVKNRAAPVVESVKNRAAPVVESVKVAVNDATATACAKGAEIGEKVKQQVASVKESVEKTVEKKAAGGEATLTDKERDMLQQLSDMGFTDQEKLLPLIRKHKDLSRVIEVLVR